MSFNAMAVLFLLLFICAIVTNLIGIFAIFGAFLLGAVLSPVAAFRESVARQFQNFVTVFFLPIFFTYTGLRTDIGSLDSALLWACCGLVILAAVAGKVLGCGIAARIGGLSWRESGCVGVLMNTRALMGLVAIHIGYDLGVVPDSLFCMLVLMALLTTFMTSPLLRLLLRGIPDATRVA
jgi:Kef-type K+ transport system membrane component KefB